MVYYNIRIIQAYCYCSRLLIVFMISYHLLAEKFWRRWHVSFIENVFITHVTLMRHFVDRPLLVEQISNFIVYIDKGDNYHSGLTE